jgi:hypothetical protein
MINRTLYFEWSVLIVAERTPRHFTVRRPSQVPIIDRPREGTSATFGLGGVYTKGKQSMRGTIVTMTIIGLSACTAAYAAEPAARARPTPSMTASMTASENPAENPNVPGATGRTIVVGNHSTIAGDEESTRMQQTGAYGGGG